uniref:Acyl-coenzyme A thioesterase 13 n=1 Tax=Arcella intermedia TaxID=1963864 RepID=A0A6B2LTT1_9EUKA
MVKCTLPITEKVSNAYGGLHGGATATLVDIVGTMAQLSVDHRKPGVSIDLNVSYTNKAPIGETVDIEGRVLKSGKSFVFTEVEIRRQSDAKLVAKGRHTKAF